MLCGLSLERHCAVLAAGRDRPAMACTAAAVQVGGGGDGAQQQLHQYGHGRQGAQVAAPVQPGVQAQQCAAPLAGRSDE